MNNLTDKKIAFIAFTNSLENNTAKSNAANFKALTDRLETAGIPYKKVIGKYGGILEQSVIISARERRTAEHLAFSECYPAQESILYVSENRNTALIYADGTLKNIGKFTETSAKKVDGRDYSLIDGRYFVIK